MSIAIPAGSWKEAGGCRRDGVRGGLSLDLITLSRGSRWQRGNLPLALPLSSSQTQIRRVFDKEQHVLQDRDTLSLFGSLSLATISSLRGSSTILNFFLRLDYVPHAESCRGGSGSSCQEASWQPTEYSRHRVLAP